ncbi:uncharacterized protein LOC133904109 isoform X2 [Phragmites australis]|uniref:uncharacterized protein LOC133904109 isoform X2 n=1 Tax=Phragmites australis TaxID=29695 RepID=UPI002D772A6C|nr:uncharacterized protein LOC133904109 isoform X2 [Phragmites australis]
MEELAELGHLLVFAFLFFFATFMVGPVMTDVTMEALCPGRDECSLAIYLTGLQQAVTGLGALVVTPIVGNLSDRYGRKALLAIPATVSIVPLGILAYDRTKACFYAYYVTKTLTAMVSEGSMQCLSLAYVADRVPETRRAAAFGVFSGVCTAGFVFGTIAARFLPVSSTFQVSVVAAVAAAVYMRAFLQETDSGASSCSRDEEACYRPLCTPSSSSEEASPRLPPLRKAPSLSAMAALLTSSTSSRQNSTTARTSMLICCLLLALQEASHRLVMQLTVMPLLVPKLGEQKLLIIALIASCVHGFLYSIAWSFWVPYLAASFVILSLLVTPCIRSIVSKKAGPFEQGMVQGCITGISSTANLISPLIFTPLTAWFLSETTPFNFKGFSIACSGFATLVALAMSINMRSAKVQQPDEI